MQHLKWSLCWLVTVFVTCCVGYKPVILMHGLFGSPIEFLEMKSFIEKVHPGTSVTNINAYDAVSSLEPMWKQVKRIGSMMRDIMTQHPDGIHLVCYSQGGLVCRAIIESTPDHNVHNFISLSSPQGGQYGDTSFLKHLFPHLLKEELYKFFYSDAGQDISIGNYWNDPHQQPMYEKHSDFLAVLNNESTVNHTRSADFKKSFVQLKNLVLIGGPDDGVITPWQSSHFAVYDKNETIVEMRKQKWYTKDWFGLKTLDKRGVITTYEVPGYPHLEWPRSFDIFQKYIEKWLT